MRRKDSIGIVLSSVAAVTSAHGGVIVTDNNCDPTIPPSAYQVVDLGNGHFNVFLLKLYKPFLNTYFEIHPTTPGVIVDNVFVDVDGPPAGSPVVVRVVPHCNDPTVKIKSVLNIIQTGTGETLLNKVDVGEDIGFVQVEVIGDLLADRDILGPIIATTGDNPARGINVARAIRDILGDLRADNGQIKFVTAIDGDVGTAANPVVIRAKHEVRSVTAVAGNIYATIDTRFNGGQGALSRLLAGTFEGTLKTREILAQQGTPGEVRLTGQLAGDIIIGRSFVQPSLMDLEPGGLTGQIIFNADNVPGSAWNASIFFGDPADPEIELTGPGYTETAASLGGGSAGLAPFALHDESCAPANGDPVFHDPIGPPLVVTLRHYGPVTWTGQPLTVERRTRCSPDPFVDVTADFVFTPAPGDNNSIIVSKAPAGAGFEIGYEYRIQATAQLLSANVAGNPPVAWDGPYTIGVLSNCPWDLDGSGCVDSADLTLLLGAWAAGTPAGDVDGDCVTDSADLTLLLGAWAACECQGQNCCQGAQGGGSDPAALDSALAVMGFGNVGQYEAWLSTASDSEAFVSAQVLLVLLSGGG